jgi:hypothetical protein
MRCKTRFTLSLPLRTILHSTTPQPQRGGPDAWSESCPTPARPPRGRSRGSGRCGTQRCARARSGGWPSAAHLPALGEVFERLPLDDHKDKGGGVADVLERLRGTLSPHTGERGSPPSSRRSGDSSRRLPPSPGRTRDRGVLPGPS